MTGHPDEPVFLDLETAPVPDVMDYLDAEKLADISPPANYKDPEKKTEYVARERDRRIAAHKEDAALDPDLARIVCLGAWFPNQPQPCVGVCEDERTEYFTLRGFWETYALGQVICGFSVRTMDLAVLYRRSLYLGVETKHIDRDRYRSTCVLDLFEVLNEGRKHQMRSLDWYCKRFGIRVPLVDEIGGKDVPRLVELGTDEAWAQIRQHCACDLHKTRALYQRVVRQTIAA